MSLLFYHLTLVAPFVYMLGLSIWIIFLLGGVLFWHPSVRSSPLHSSVAPFLSAACFILLGVASLSLFSNPLLGLRVLIITFGVLSGVGWALFLKHYASSLLSHRGTVLGLFTLVLGLMYFLFRLTYQNGLHDEYYHHAIIELFFKTNSFPFLEPYRLGATLSGYHYGLYIPVIAIRTILPISTETALDGLKLALFLPLIPSLSILISRLFSLSVIRAGFLSSCSFILGPSFFFLDTFTANVRRGEHFAQLFTPLLFEYAGITWHGLTFLLVFLLFAASTLRTKKSFSALPTSLFLTLTIFTLVLTNQVFFLVYIASLAILGLGMIALRRIDHHFVLISLVFVLASLISLLWMRHGRMVADQRTSIGIPPGLHPGEKPLAPFIRPASRIGIPYFDESKPIDSSSRLSYATLKAPFFYRSAGVLWFVVGALFLLNLKSEWKRDAILSILLVFLLVLPLVVYLTLTPTDDLALTKFMRPAFFLIPILLAYFALKTSRFTHAILLSLLLMGVVSPVYFFVTARLEGLQRSWVVNNKEDQDLLWFFDRQTVGIVQVETNTPETQQMLANTIASQVTICYENCGYKEIVDVVVRDKRGNQTIDSKRKRVFESKKYIVYE